jgi:hypothetical protein
MIGEDAAEGDDLPGLTVTPAPNPAELAAIVMAFRIRNASAAPARPARVDAWLVAARREGLRGQPSGWGLDGWELAAHVRR